MPDKIIAEIAAMSTAVGTFFLAIIGRSSLDKDIRGLRRDKLNVDRFEDFKENNEKEHLEIKNILMQIFAKLDKD